MPVFTYKGVTANGRKVAGVLDAESLKAVKARLKKEGIIVLDISEASPGRAERGREISFGMARVGVRRLADATRQLATLLSSGLPLMDAIGVLVEQEEGAGLKAALASVRDDVRGGSSLADALRANQRIFPPLYVNMVAAGEASGTLEITLERLADFLEEQARFRGRLAAALAYPMLMTIIGVGVLFFLFSFVLPRVVAMFEDMKQQLPFITLLLLRLVGVIQGFWWLILGLVAGAAYYLKRYFSTPHGRERLDSMLLRLPVFGSVIRMIAVSRFTRTLGTLLQGGVHPLTALDIVKNIVGNTVLASAIQKARDNVREGESITEPLRRSGLFPPVVVQMVSVGEKSGELEKMLLKVSDSFDRSVESRITALLSLMEPVIILVMGVIVGFIVIAILLPILEMSAGVR